MPARIEGAPPLKYAGGTTTKRVGSRVGRRIEVELTSTREDGSWTWRAAGAKQPRGELSGELLYGGAKVGDVVKAEADFHLDGIEIVEVFPPKAKKERTDLLQLKTRPIRDDELVTTQRISRRDRGDRGRRGDRPGRSDRGDRGDRRDRRGGSGRREPRADRPQRPKPKRLRPRREHRDALLASVAEEHQPIVEQLVRDGMPGVRAAIDKQNTEAKGAGKPEIDAAPILAIAERNLAAARLAEWRDRADAALATIEDLDLRDLRSVVVVGNDVARDDESRALAEQLKSSLDERMEKDHGQWLTDLQAAVADGRVVRALRLSSRPVKAGAPLPTELAGELSRQAAAALTPDVEQARWAIVLDALAFSPVRGAVTPVGIPAEPGEELLNEVRRLSDRIPAIAGLFGIDPAQVPRRAKRRRPSRGGKSPDRKPKAKKSGGAPASKPKEAAAPSPSKGAQEETPSKPEQPPVEAVEPEQSDKPAVAKADDGAASEPDQVGEQTVDDSTGELVEPEAATDAAETPVDGAPEPAAETPADGAPDPAGEAPVEASPEPEAETPADGAPDSAGEPSNGGDSESVAETPTATGSVDIEPGAAAESVDAEDHDVSNSEEE